MNDNRAEIVRQFFAVLKAEDWQPTKTAIEKIVDMSLKHKKVLRKMLSLHPRWDDATMRITMPVETNGERLDVPDKMSGFRNMCIGVDISPLDVFETILTRGGALTFEDCIDLEAKGYNGGKVGQKIGRAINAWATANEVNKHDDYNWKFNELINGGKNTTDRVAVLSINPVDFLTASHGDFSSCHSINLDREHCYRSGNLSYAMDKVTMVFFTINPDESPNYPTKRIDRINYHFKSGLLIQGRLYTATRENIHVVSRAMVCKAIAECLNVPNLWTKHGYVDKSRIASSGNHYRDYVHQSSTCTMSTLTGATLPNRITIGHIALCIHCGEKQAKGSILDCCNGTHTRNMLTCESCSRSVHEDDAVWVSNDAYCSGCTCYCEHCERSHHKDDVLWVEHLRKYLCDRCIEDDYAKCGACEKIVKKDDANDAGGVNYCEDCYRERFSDCEECGEAFKKDELTKAEDGRGLCRDCHCAKLVEQVLCEPVAA